MWQVHFPNLPRIGSVLLMLLFFSVCSIHLVILQTAARLEAVLVYAPVLELSLYSPGTSTSVSDAKDVQAAVPVQVQHLLKVAPVVIEIVHGNRPEEVDKMILQGFRLN